MGAAIRFGGHDIDGHVYGVENEAYDNLMVDNAYAAIKLMVGDDDAAAPGAVLGVARRRVYPRLCQVEKPLLFPISDLTDGIRDWD